MPQEHNIGPQSHPLPQQLEFSSLEEVIQRLERLHRDGYRSLGKWNLAQVCEHLSDWMVFMIDGYPKAPLPVNLMMWGMRVSVGKSLLRKILTTGKMAAGGPTMQQTVHAADGLKDEASLQRLKETAQRLASYRGTYAASPLFGPLSAEDGLKLQLVHCAHHLRFLEPA